MRSFQINQNWTVTSYTRFVQPTTIAATLAAETDKQNEETRLRRDPTRALHSLEEQSHLLLLCG